MSRRVRILLGARGGGSGGGIITPPPGDFILPPMAVWGESLAQGSAASSDGTAADWFPERLNTLVKDYYGKTTTTYNGGYGGQRLEGIAARQGGTPGQFKAFTVPTTGGITLPQFPSNNNDTVAFTNGVDVLGNDKQQSALPVKLYPTSMAGQTPPFIAGLLTKVDNGDRLADNWPFRFQRNVAGLATPVAVNDKLTFDTGDTYRNHAHIIWAGHNQKSTTPGTGNVENISSVADRIRPMTVWAQPPVGALVKRFVVLGMIGLDARPAIARGLVTQAEADAADAKYDLVNIALAAEWGDKFVPLKSYLASMQAGVDYGLWGPDEPVTAERQRAIDYQYPMPEYSVWPHLNKCGNWLVANQTKNKIVELDWRIYV